VTLRLPQLGFMPEQYMRARQQGPAAMRALQRAVAAAEVSGARAVGAKEIEIEIEI
jgi:hypothetical protein